MTAGRDRARRRPPPRRRRQRGPLAFAALAAALGLLVGVLIGYAARGGPSDAPPRTVDSSVPVVTVTVPAE